MADESATSARNEPSPNETIQGGVHAGRIINKHIENGVIILDFGEFINCVFAHCQLVYKGGLPFSADTVHMRDSTFLFANEAQNTLGMLRQLAAMGSQEMVLAMIGIRVETSAPETSR